MKIIVLAIILVLAGCSREPMIQLSEDNRIRVETKQTDRDQEGELTTTDQPAADDADTNQESDSQNMDEDEENIEETDTLPQDNQEDISITIDRTKWVNAPADSEYNLMDYMPVPSNQINQYHTNQSDLIVLYMEYFNESTGQSQVRRMNSGQVTIDLYSVANNQIQWLGQMDQAIPYTNYLEAGLPATNESNQPLILLSAPLQAGNRWENGESNQSEIVGLYDEIQIEDQSYENVIEVRTQTDNQISYLLYAAKIGLVASWQENDNQITEFEYLTDSVSEVMLIYDRPIYQPLENSNTGALIEEALATFSWQTNDTVANAFRRLFQEQNWIGDEISVLNINVSDGIGVVNFTSGVVATLNEHPAGEQAVIAALVSTVADFLQVDSVRLEVFGNGMLPATIDYPEAGVYSINPAWLTGTDTIDADSEYESNNNESLSINLEDFDETLTE